jgi:hypothetical protein
MSYFWQSQNVRLSHTAKLKCPHLPVTAISKCPDFDAYEQYQNVLSKNVCNNYAMAKRLSSV